MRNLVLFAVSTGLLAGICGPLRGQSADPASLDRARSVLTEGASDRDPENRREVAVALSLTTTKDPSASLLRTLAQDKDHLTREAAVVSIGELGDRQMFKLLEEALNDDVPEVVFAAARTLMRMKHPEGRRILFAILEREEKAESSFFRGTLRDLARRVKTPKSAVFFAVQQSAGLVPLPGFGQGLSALTSILGDADFSARATALLILAEENSPQVRAAIEQAFQDDDWSVRAAAIQLAALRQETRWKFRIIPLIDDTNRKVRYRAAAVSVRLSYPGGRPLQRKR